MLASLPPLPMHLQGTRRELLRALCQVVNTTGLDLEACLVDVEDSDWSMIASRSGALAPFCSSTPSIGWQRLLRGRTASKAAPALPRLLTLPPLAAPASSHPAPAGSVTGAVSADSVEEEVIENERFARGTAGAQWSAANLRRGEDPRRFQYALHEVESFPQVRSGCTRAA